MNQDTDEIQRRNVRLRKIMTFAKIMIIFSLLLALFTVVLVVTGQITGFNDIILNGVQAFFLPGLFFALYLNLKKQIELNPELVRRRMEIWKPVRMPTIIAIFSGAAVEAVIVILYPNARGLIAALVFGAILFSVLAYFIRRTTKLSWKEILLGKMP